MQKLDKLIELGLALYDACKSTEDDPVCTSEADLIMEPAEDIENAFRVTYQKRNIMYITVVGLDNDQNYCLLGMYFAGDSKTNEVVQGPQKQYKTDNLEDAIDFFYTNLKEAAMSSQMAILDQTLEGKNG